RIDAGDPAVEKAPPLLRRAAQDLQPRRGVGEDGHGADVARQRHALAVDEQHALFLVQTDGERLPDLALQRPADEHAGRAVAHEAGQARRAERFGRGQEVDGLEQVRLALPVAANDEVDALVERDRRRGKVAEVVCGDAAEDHASRIGMTTYRYSYGRSV